MAWRRGGAAGTALLRAAAARRVPPPPPAQVGRAGGAPRADAALSGGGAPQRGSGPPGRREPVSSQQSRGGAAPPPPPAPPMGGASAAAPPGQAAPPPRNADGAQNGAAQRERRVPDDAPANRRAAALAPSGDNRRMADFAAGDVSSTRGAGNASSGAAAGAPPPAPPAAPVAAAPVAREVPSLRDALDAYKIALPSYTAGQHRLQCPLCRGGSDGERSLAVAVEAGGATAKWLCHRATCGWTGGVSATGATAPDGAAPPQVVIRGSAKGGSGAAAATPAAEAKAPADLPREADILPASSNATVAAFFAGRGISEATLQRNGVGVARVWNPPAGRVADSIVFPYRRAGTLVNCKYRAVESKTFWQSKGGEKVLYGLDDIADAEQVVIVEGEMDKLAMEQAGFRNCVSVPDGAPAKVKDGPTPAPEDDKKFSYLWNCRAWLDRVKTFIIATDADEPGEALAEELARRLGRERCWRVTWPGTAVAGEAAPDPETVRKDANEVLMKDGPEALASLVAGAQPVPIRGLFQFTDFSDEIDRYYGLELHAELRGLPTGWVGVDQLYRVVPGELTVVTGVPNSGKSEWVDALMCNLAVTAGWSFALCSMENKVHEHARKLIEKFTGRPFFDGEYAGSARRMSPQELAAGKAFLADHFVLIRHEDDELPSIDWVLGLARAAVLRYGIRGLLVDPYNELDHRRPTNVSETEYVSQMLTRIKRFAAHHDVHVWFVAHPRQLQNWRGEPPGLYEISGSAHFVNKCDNGLVVHRNRTDPARANEVRVLVQKVRNKVAGRIGETTLLYDRASGRYADSDQKSQPLRFPEGGNSAFQAPREGR